MIICSNCGGSLSEGLNFCTECGAEVPDRRNENVQAATLPLDISAGGRALTPGSAPVNPAAYASPPAYGQAGGVYEANQVGSASPPQSSTPKTLLIALGVTTIIALALMVYFMARSGSSSANASPENSANASPESLSASLKSAVDKGQLVTLSGDDAYTYFFRLRDREPQHKMLTEIKPKVLPQLRRLGDEVISRRVSMSLEILTERDWTIAQRAYEWAHLLEPGDKNIEARWKYAEGNVAKAQNRRDDAQSSFAAAVQLDSSWAVPVNDLGYLYTLNKRYTEAIPYYQRAINLQPGWDIPYNNMGTAYYYQKSYDAAETWYRKTVEVNAKWATPHFWLGSIYENKKLSGAAISEYETGLNLYDPNRDRVTTVDIQNKIDALRGN